MKTALPVLLILLMSQSASAQLGRLIREGVGMLRPAKAVRETSTAAGKLMRKSVPSKAMPDVGKAVTLVTRHGEDITQPVIAALGDDGIEALASLSPQGAKSLSAMATELANSPHRGEWLDTIATYGDEAVEWLWRRRGSIAVGTAATAVLMKPEAFLSSSERVANTVIETAGSQVIKPIIQETAEHIAEPLATHMVTPLFATLGVFAVLTIGYFVFPFLRMRRHT